MIFIAQGISAVLGSRQGGRSHGRLRQAEERNAGDDWRRGGGEVKSQGVFVDLLAQERVTASENAACPRCQNKFTTPVREAKKTFEQAFPVAPAFVLSH